MRKINFICDLPVEHFAHWNDGLKAALDYLVEKYNWEVKIYNIPTSGASVPDDAEFSLFWGALDKHHHRRKFFKKQGLCFGGGPTYHPNIRNFDIVFAESKIDLEEFENLNVNTVQAFGTNTKLFREIPNQPKIFDFIYPTAFAKWKNHERFVEYVVKFSEGKSIKALAVGYMQPDGWEKECYEICLENGISVLPWVPPSALPYLLSMSRNVLITADPNGGCQRTVLEAKACNVPVIIDSVSPKLKELEELTYEQVLKDWSEIAYAEKLKKGIDEVLNK